MSAEQALRRFLAARAALAAFQRRADEHEEALRRHAAAAERELVAALRDLTVAR